MNFKRLIKAGLYYSGASDLYAKFFLNHQAIILGYHRVGDGSSGLCIKEEVFAMQMEYLSNHCQVIPLQHLVELLKEHKPIPPRSCVITFDDGTIDNFQIAAPILERFSLPATFFVIGNKVTGADANYFNETQANVLLASGHLIGFHTLTHPHLTQIPTDHLPKELFSRSPCFAYPYGDFNAEVAAAVRKAGYFCAVTTRPGFVDHDSDLFALPRIQIDNESTSSIELFATRLLWIPRSSPPPHEF